MTTELELIYTMWDVIRAGNPNQDDKINERLMRSFLRLHRGKHLSKAYFQGAELPDEVYQYLGAIPFTATDKGEFISPVMPKAIPMNGYGYMVSYEGYTISVVNSGEWARAKHDRFNKYHPMIKILNNHMIMSPGMNQPNQLDDHTGSALNTVVNAFGLIQIGTTVSIDVQAVLVNPDDEPGYDFTTSPYPYPDELIEDLVNSVNAREFNLYLRMKADETGDMRDDAGPKG